MRVIDWLEQKIVDSPLREAYFRAVERPILQRAPVPPSPTLLEIGAGNGRLGRYLQKLWKPRLHVQIDLNPRGPGVLKADAARLPFADQSFDVVVELCCFHHVPNYRQAIQEARRVGRLFVYEDMAYDHWLFWACAHNGQLSQKDFPGTRLGYTHSSFIGYAGVSHAPYRV